MFIEVTDEVRSKEFSHIQSDFCLQSEELAPADH